MSDDESVVLALAVLLGAGAWMTWFGQAFLYAANSSRRHHRWPLWVHPAVSTALLFAVLRFLAADDVRNDARYLWFYLMMGATWTGLTARFLGLFGLSYRDDVIERINPAAAHAIGGAVIGITLCFAGGNIGNGPGWWVVVFSALLSTGGLFLVWILLDRAAGVNDTVTIDRDLAAGFRLAGFFIAAGLILGRAVAGDWESAAATVVDFARTGWPVLVLLVLAAGIEQTLRPTPERPVLHPVAQGLAPAAVYLGIAAGALAWVGWR